MMVIMNLPVPEQKSKLIMHGSQLITEQALEVQPAT